MPTDWVSRPYRLGDEKAIIRLHSTVFEEEQTLQYWDWLCRKNPAGPAWIWLAWSGDELVGHYAVIPESLLVNGKPVLGAQSLDTMTHPAYQRRGIFVELAKRTYEDAESHGVVLTYGFPNERSRPGLVQRLEWRDVLSFSRFVKILKPKAIVENRMTAAYVSFISRRGDSRLRTARRQAHGCEVEAIGRFPDDYDVFWRQTAPSSGITINRDARYMQWRYLEHPDCDYRVLAARREGELVGVAAMAILQTKGTREGFIASMETGSATEGALEHMLEGFQEICEDEGVVRLTCIMHRSHLAKRLRRLGFLERPAPLPIAVRAPKPEEVTVNPFVADNWTLEVGDTDYI